MIAGVSILVAARRRIDLDKRKSTPFAYCATPQSDILTMPKSAPLYLPLHLSNFV